MPAYVFTPATFNGNSINAGNLVSYFDEQDPGPFSASRSYDAVESSVPGLGDRDVRGQPKGSTWLLTVQLLATNQTDIDAFYKVFSEENGVVDFVGTDGGGAAWRARVRQIGAIKRISASVFKVPLRLADPRFVENAATTNSQLNKQTSPISPTLTNNGNRAMRPLFTITADAAKTGVANDFGLQLQGYIVNRGPNDIVNKPVYLFDSNGAAGRLSTSGVGLANGDDCRVWLDDVPDIPRWLVAWNTAASDVVINVTLPASIPMTLVAAMTAAVPANGASFSLNEDIGRLPQSGFVVIDNEVIYFASRAGRTLFGIQRAQWGSTAAIHVITSNVYANPRHYVVATSYAGIIASGYGPPPSPAAQRPCIQLPASSNQALKWGDETDDPNTIFFDRNNPDRTAQWQPGFDADGNTNGAPISLTQSDTILSFTDNVPGDGNPPYNYVEIAVPQGISVLSSKPTVDWTPQPEELNLEMWYRDNGGNLILVDQLQQSAAAAGRVAPTKIAAAYGMKLKARYNVATGFYTVAGFDTGFVPTIQNLIDDPAKNGARGQVFTLDKDTYVRGAQVWLKQGGNAQNISAGIFPDSNGQPAFGGVTSSAASGAVLQGAPISLASGAAWQQLSWTMGPVLLPAGKYHLILWRSATIGSYQPTYAGKQAPTNYTKGYAEAEFSDGVMSRLTGNMSFRILSDYDPNNNAYINNEQPIRNGDATPTTRVGLTASFDKVILTLQTTNVKVSRMTAFTAGLFHAYGTLANTTTGDTIGVDLWMPLTATLAIDCDARTVTHTAAAVAYPVTKAITPSNTADWMACPPGANALVYTDASLAAPGQMDLVSVYRGTKV